jgi:hypothetical protein
MITPQVSLSFMGPSVDFDDQSLLRTEKVRNKWWDRHLATEFET